MKERPILFNAEMVRAVLGGRKTQTRRIIAKQPSHGLYIQAMHGTSPDGKEFGDKSLWRIVGPDYPDDSDDNIVCPFGVPGDRLWVRESYFQLGHWEATGAKTRTGRLKWKFVSDDRKILFEAPSSFRNRQRLTPAVHKRLARFMPRWASRITLEIVSIKVERLQDISEWDAAREGVELEPGVSCISKFKILWDRINGCDAWGKNPWVWKIEFKKL